MALLALLALLPWIYGAVHLPARGAYVVAASMLSVAGALRTRPKRLELPAVLLVSALAWAGLALVPLPADLLAAVAPASHRIAVQNFAEAGLPAPAWHPIAVAPADAARAWATAAAHVLVFLTASRALAGRRGARRAAAVLALSGGAMALLAITQQAMGAKRIFFSGLAREQFYGTFVNGNHAATFLAIGALSGLGLLLRERESGRKLVWGLAAVVSAIGAMYSLSRGGVIALAAGMAVFLAGAMAVQGSAPRRSRDEIGRFFRRNAVPLMLAGLAVFYLSWLGPRRIGRELATLAALDLPNDYRTRVWSDSFDIVADWPVTGSGAGTFAHVFPQYRSFPADVTTEMAESDWVQTVAENGMPGFLLVAAALLFLLGRFGASFAREPLRFSGAHLGAAAALVALAAHAMVDFPTRVPAIGAIGALLAGVLAGAARKSHGRGPPFGDRAVRVALPALAVAALAASLGAAGRDEVPRDRGRAIAILRERPADARAWIRYARTLPEGEGRAAFAHAARLDPNDPIVQRAAAAGLARAGAEEESVAILASLLDRLHAGGGVAFRTRASDLALELAARQLFTDPDAAARTLAAAAPGPRRSLVAADIAAARAVDPSGTRAAIEAYLAVVEDARRGHAGDVEALARRRALLLTVNAVATLPPPEGRAWISRLALALDPGLVLADVAALAAEGKLDAARLWGAAGPRVDVDDFSAGEPRLTAEKALGTIEAHAVESGAERLQLRYPERGVLADRWDAPLGFRTTQPRLALSARVRAGGRLGGQVCVRAGGRIAWGAAGEPDASGWQTVVVRGFAADATGAAPVMVSGWCFDTRGRPGPFLLDDVALFLE